jgi:hypothetical protein
MVNPEPQASKALEGALARRFGQDYGIQTAESADTALQLLGRLADGHGDAALMAAEVARDGAARKNTTCPRACPGVSAYVQSGKPGTRAV